MTNWDSFAGPVTPAKEKKPKRKRRSKARLEAERFVEEKPAPKSVMPKYVGPPKIDGKFDVWFDNKGNRSVMFRGYNIRPGDGAWVTERAAEALKIASKVKK